MIIYTNKFIKDWAAGCQIWCFAFIRLQHKGNQAIEAHELEHVRQWWVTTILAAAVLGFAVFVMHRHLVVPLLDVLPFIALSPSVHGVLYLALKKYRLWAEVQAYKASIAFRPLSIDHYAALLASKYRLDITPEQAKSLLT